MERYHGQAPGEADLPKFADLIVANAQEFAGIEPLLHRETKSVVKAL